MQKYDITILVTLGAPVIVAGILIHRYEKMVGVGG
jgi:hypothetical protein